MMPPEKDNSAVRDFLEREKEDMLAMEKMALSAKKSALGNSDAAEEKHDAPIDWDRFEQYLLSPGVVNLDLESAAKSQEFAFLVERYEREPDSEIMREALAAAKQKRVERKAENEIRVKEAEKKASEFISKIEAEEQADYEKQEMHLEEYYLMHFNSREIPRKPDWTAEEKQLNNYKQVIDIYESISNAQRPERVIEILKSIVEEEEKG